MSWVQPREKPTPKTLFDETDPTGTIRSAINVENYSLLSLHVEHGALTGALTLWASNKASPGTGDDSDWKEVASGEASIADPSGTAGGELVNMSAVAHRWVMVKYVHDTGTGDLYVGAMAKAQ